MQGALSTSLRNSKRHDRRLCPVHVPHTSLGGPLSVERVASRSTDYPPVPHYAVRGGYRRSSDRVCEAQNT